MLKDFIRQSVPWTTYLAKKKIQNKTYVNYLIKNQKNQLNKKVINEFYIKNPELKINFPSKTNNI